MEKGGNTKSNLGALTKPSIIRLRESISCLLIDMNRAYSLLVVWILIECKSPSPANCGDYLWYLVGFAEHL